MYDSVLNSWSYVQDMNKSRYEHSACVLNGKIIVVGGRDANFDIVKEIECYDPTSNNWSVMGHIGDDLYNHSVTAV